MMMSCRVSIPILAVLTGLPVTQAQAQRATADTAAASAVHRAVQREIDRGRMTRRDTTVTCSDHPWEIGVQLYADRTGHVRRLVVSGGTDDHADETTYDYDLAGRLRHASAERGAVNMTHQQERVWYSSTGAVLLRRRRITHGPGYPFDEILAIPDARRWRASLCDG